jgi:hypothetical protein
MEQTRSRERGALFIRFPDEENAFKNPSYPSVIPFSSRSFIESCFRSDGASSFSWGMEKAIPSAEPKNSAASTTSQKKTMQRNFILFILFLKLHKDGVKMYRFKPRHFSNRLYLHTVMLPKGGGMSRVQMF